MLLASQAFEALPNAVMVAPEPKLQRLQRDGGHIRMWVAPAMPLRQIPIGSKAAAGLLKAAKRGE